MKPKGLDSGDKKRVNISFPNSALKSGYQYTEVRAVYTGTHIYEYMWICVFMYIHMYVHIYYFTKVYSVEKRGREIQRDIRKGQRNIIILKEIFIDCLLFRRHCSKS